MLPEVRSELRLIPFKFQQLPPIRSGSRMTGSQQRFYGSHPSVWPHCAIDKISAQRAHRHSPPVTSPVHLQITSDLSVHVARLNRRRLDLRLVEVVVDGFPETTVRLVDDVLVGMDPPAMCAGEYPPTTGSSLKSKMISVFHMPTPSVRTCLTSRRLPATPHSAIRLPCRSCRSNSGPKTPRVPQCTRT